MSDKCRDCKFWTQPEDYALRLACLNSHDDAPDCWSDPEEAIAFAERTTGNKVGECRSPKLNRTVFTKEIEPVRPRFKEASIVDGEEYYAALLTDENFGCVNFEAKV